MDLYEVVTKLIGPIEPVGETQTDDKRFENLKAMTELVDKLLSDIDGLIEYKSQPEYSMKRAGLYADKFLDNCGIQE